MTDVPLAAVAAPSLAERIDAALRPVADALSAFIFHAVPVGAAGGQAMFPLIVGWLIVAAVVATLYFRFINLRGFRHGLDLIRGRFSDPDASGEVSHFRALTSAVSGTVGLGNIAGVAVAISIGGPGATFWMIVAGLLAMSSKFVECTLGVMYRIEHPDGSVAGGPMYYLRRGIAANYPRLAPLGLVLALAYALCTMMGAVGSGAAFQANQAYHQFAGLGLVQSAEAPLWFGLFYAVLAGAVILGGIGRIGSVTARLVPAMAVLYLAGALFVILVNLPALPGAVRAILEGAFTAEGVSGGVVGALIQGFRRAVFSNEAGLGSAAIAHSAVRTREPLSEGFVALWEPFLDTVVICTMTALVIVITGQHLAGGADGVQLTSAAFATVSPWFPYVLAGVVFLFAFSTSITWGYYGATACGFLFGESKLAVLAFKLVFLAGTIAGCTLPLGSIVDFADALLFIMAVPNLIGVYLLMPVVKRALDDYLARLRSGTIRPTR
jgi:AGCS family alanine or glycine:cation symporter